MASPSWPAISAIGERSAANSWRVITPQLMGRVVRRQARRSWTVARRMAGSTVVGLTALVALLSDATATTAQDRCTYTSCALRLQSGFFKQSLVQGATGENLANVLFLAPALCIFAERSDSAAFYYGAFRRARNQSFWLSLSGGLLVVTAILIEEIDRAQSELTWSVGIPGLALLFTGVVRGVGSGNKLSKAVWWYNSTLPRSRGSEL